MILIEKKFLWNTDVWMEFRGDGSLCANHVGRRWCIPHDVTAIWVALHSTSGDNRWPVCIYSSRFGWYAVAEAHEKEIAAAYTLTFTLYKKLRPYLGKRLYAEVTYEE